MGIKFELFVVPQASNLLWLMQQTFKPLKYSAAKFIAHRLFTLSWFKHERNINEMYIKTLKFSSMIFVRFVIRCNNNSVGKLSTSQGLLSFLAVNERIKLHEDLKIKTNQFQTSETVYIFPLVCKILNLDKECLNLKRKWVTW